MKSFINFMLLLLLTGQTVWANMASPVRPGSMVSTALSSKDIRIVSEKIHIKIDPVFQTASFIVEYRIESALSGRQIPLLFYAQDYKDSFAVWLDNKSMNVENVPATHYENSPFEPFSGSLKKNENGDEITIYWDNSGGYVYKLSELKYFEADIEKGTHTIRVEYRANAWTDVSGWTKESGFRYSLTPAKFWQSFGSLDITVEQTGTSGRYETNLGHPVEKTIGAVNTWHFNGLPAEYIEIIYAPQPGRFAGFLIALEPFGICLIAALLLAGIHIWKILAYRRGNLQKNISPVVMWGSLLVPLLALLTFIFSFNLIDLAIGKDAAGHHGYVWLSIFLYPILVIAYWPVCWLIDKLYKKKCARTITGD